ncbi:ER membrane protein DP1/Yop1 [Tilletia horrida]|uniref:Protein YOP1 n=1 Tax=Tilletia horrida TaxID=155126 RepID=A0AAN6GC54_9BASI|nr:ER membrane protein DP1/Yop1 [Tilletia horrida]KAK0524925.1 ER membrane protein DP1/Yop1 [Tilletia horrida]KAK0530722.1 ER membrane protein DP1/Yop1 [Tilletia horrida]KAK0555993.1 ER membrane protein DP1/Yop1 [Tilletia horrida]
MAAQVQQIQAKLQQILADVDRELNNVPLAVKLERQTGLPKAPVVVGAVGLVAFLVFFNILAAMLTTAVGFLLPAYYSMQALEQRSGAYEKQWLTYWSVFGLFTVLEQFSDFILSFFPFYYTAKLLTLLWLQLPQTQGAKVLYDRFLQPIVAQNINTRRVPSTSTTVPVGADQ